MPSLYPPLPTLRLLRARRGFSTEPAIRLAARIARMAPKGLSHVMFTSGG
jgi:adenosylmethionine-8-amino-7-oxononanoate aminotransferase